jgi:hypothetical protein
MPFEPAEIAYLIAWATQAPFEARLKELLPASTLRYLDELGVLEGTEVSS